MSSAHELDRKNTLRLMRCPHCEGSPTGVVWMEYFVDMDAWPTARIICGECNSMMDTHGMSRDDAVEKAIQKWNRRADNTFVAEWNYNFDVSGDVECANCNSVFPVLTEWGVGQSKPQYWSYCPDCGTKMSTK